MADAPEMTKPTRAVDAEALREKYRIERDKRVRSDGEEQYVEAAGQFAHYNEEDPYAEPGFTRDPLTEEVEVAIIGGGFSGMLAAVRLREAGVTDIRIIEAGGDFGGTWYWNRYPGAQCDIDAYCYLPLLEELGYVPKEKYSFSPEIYEHSQRIGREYGLYDLTHFQTRVRDIAWDETIKRWHIHTNRDDDIRARFVIMALGTASRAKLPGIPGIESFKGHSFHTSRWDYAYTGGDCQSDLDKLGDKKVAIIGTGATAIQCVPAVGRSAEHLYVFQRTPSGVDARGNLPTDPEWAANLKPGWQRERRENFNDIVVGNPFSEDMVNDGWTDVFRRARERGWSAATANAEGMAETLELIDFEKMSEVRARCDETVEDKATADALKPWYRQFCKRPTFNDEYLPTFNRPNVTLVDVGEAKGVERITEKGVIANGQEYEVDCIIYSTGFEISASFQRRIGFEIKGRDNRSLYDHFANGFRTLHGFTSNGFPNWFYMGISQNALAWNMTAMFDDQAQHIAYIIRQTRARGFTTVEPTEEGQEGWVSTIRELAFLNAEFLDACTPGYYNNEGSSGGGLNAETYGAGINAFNAVLSDWRNEGTLAGMKLGK